MFTSTKNKPAGLWFDWLYIFTRELAINSLSLSFPGPIVILFENIYKIIQNKSKFLVGFGNVVFLYSVHAKDLGCVIRLLIIPVAIIIIVLWDGLTG
jgi:hypothetical protein